MIITRRIPKKAIIALFLRFSLPTALWAGIVFALYSFGGFTFLKLPFLPIATIGTAVAFYIGFKNNSAYDRFWEGRKIWGGIVNVSRTWGAAVPSYVEPLDEEDTHQVLLYRHLAWVNALRLQLRKNSRFFDRPARATARRLAEHEDHMRNDWDTELDAFLTKEELEEVSSLKNPATHILKNQSAHLARLKASGHLDLFHQIELMQMIQECYTLQGKCERIKNTPFPRQYAEMSRLFVRVFVFLLPFGMLDIFAIKEGAKQLASPGAATLMITSTAVVAWVFLTMEGIGDSSEDPFERSMNDVPMNALSRTIEIDLREMLHETDLPEKEAPTGFILY